MWICQVFDWINANSGFFQALFTLGLVVATVGLFIATNRYRKATERLADTTDEYRKATERYADATDRMKEMQQLSSAEKLLDYYKLLLAKGESGGYGAIIGIRKEDPKEVKTQKREEFKTKVLEAYGKLVEELLEDIFF